MAYVTYFKFSKHNNFYTKKNNVTNLSVSLYSLLLVSYSSRKSRYFRNTNNLTGHRDVDALFPRKHKMNCIYNAAEFHASQLQLHLSELYAPCNVKSCRNKYHQSVASFDVKKCGPFFTCVIQLTRQNNT